MKLFEMQNVCVRYDGKEVLSNIELAVQEGDFIGIIGPNGSGKSTLVGCLCGLSPYEGKIMADSRELRELSPRQRSRLIGVAPQIMPDYLSFCAREVVLMGRVASLKHFQDFSVHDYSACDEAMKNCSVDGLSHRVFSTLSGGERQRVSIAAALCTKAQVLVLDEPTNHLDMNHSLEVMKLLKDLNDKGSAVICVMHDIELAARFCKKLALLDSGKLLSFGEPKEVLTKKRLEEVYQCKVSVAEDPLTGSLRVVTL